MPKFKTAYYFHPVHDIRLAYTFFREVLGFPLVYSHLTDVAHEITGSEELDKLQWLEFDGGNFTLLVQHVPNIKPYETGLGFEVENCDEAYVYLKNHGVEMVGPIQGIVNNNRFFEIKDPTGSIFNIFGN
jgi:predicted enzyme related to lactoylglutathione lyase